MKICIIHPTSNARSSGNRITALRWGRILKSLDCSVQISTELPEPGIDLLIAMNPAKIGALALDYLANSPNCRLIFAITGTDLHGSETNLNLSIAALEKAFRIICINPLSKELLPAKLKSRCSVILQSCSNQILDDNSEISRKGVIIVGHLRSEKDPMLILDALEQIDKTSRPKVSHFGAALDESYRELAYQASTGPLPYTWYGEVEPQRVQQEMRKAKALVLSSRVEGAPAVISEAIAYRLPIIGTDIAGIRGLLGNSYPALFPVGDSRALAKLLSRLEKDENWRQHLTDHITNLQPRFSYKTEVNSFRDLLASCLE